MLVKRIVPAGLRDGSKRRRRAISSGVSRRRGAPSLDSVNHLATSEKETFAEWLKRQETAQDRRRKAYSTWESLLESLRVAGLNEKDLKHQALLECVLPDRGTSVTRHLAKQGKKPWSAWRDFARVSACQTQWKAFRSSCCEGRSLAVPIGCNHRLCPLCNPARAEHYRSRVKALFEHPRPVKVEGDAPEARNWQLLTLTVPNCRKLTKLTIATLRKRLKAFLALNAALIEGGVYSIEITRNRERRDWHPHIHCLVDVAGVPGVIPYEQFMERKWRLEFDWFILTQGKREDKRRWYSDEFEEWVRPLDPRQCGRTLTPPNVKALAGKGFGDRRSVDLRPVSSDKKAAYEVMKYMTKVAYFVGDHRAVAEFLQAVKGVRAIQTFGSCYGFKLEEKPAEASLSCECGENKWESIGILGLGMVAMDESGRWHVRDDAPVHGRLNRCRGKTTGRSK